MDVTPFSSAQAFENAAIQEPRFLGGMLILARVANHQRLLGTHLGTIIIEG
jgi:hypothetical protein